MEAPDKQRTNTNTELQCAYRSIIQHHPKYESTNTPVDVYRQKPGFDLAQAGPGPVDKDLLMQAQRESMAMDRCDKQFDRVNLTISWDRVSHLVWQVLLLKFVVISWDQVASAI